MLNVKYNSLKISAPKKARNQVRDLQETIKEAACKSEETLDDLKFEESKSVNFVNKEKASSNRYKPN